MRVDPTRDRFSETLPETPRPAVYAVISEQGQQHKVRVGDLVRLDHKKSSEPGQELTFDRVLLVSNEGSVTVGAPVVEGASVTGEVVRHSKGEKLVVFRFKRRKNIRVKNGHRQPYTDVRVTAINA